MQSAATTIFFALVVAGCANLTWQKPGTGPGVAAADFQHCQQQARLSANRLGSSGTQTMPMAVRSPDGTRTVLMPSPVPARDALAEMDFLGACMRGRGYQLVEGK
jgi:cytosine/adenosine deaminase-related metal-dependent hydrolase